jgi:type IV fimbrial biogenesis protein FimT
VLANRHAEQGVTMIELMVGIAIVAILFSLASPSLSSWLQNSQIRAAADAIQSGLMLARAESVRRNTTVRFQLTSTLNSSCALSTSGTNWVVSLADPTGACGNPSADPGDPNPPAPAIIQVRAGAQGSRNALVAAGQSTIVFNGLGRITPVPAGNIDIAISNPTGGNCAVLGGPMRCLQVVVSPGGQVRMCDPMFVSPDPQGC